MSQHKLSQHHFRNLSMAAGAFISATTMLSATGALALPAGGQVVDGNITFDTNSLTQTSNHGIAKFNSFNIGDGETYNVNNGNGATLIRDMQSSRTNIAGTLNATGKVMIVNGNGVFFDRTAQVNVGSLVATTSDITNDDFMNSTDDTYNFTQSKNTRATVENKGTITAGLKGTVALIANGGVTNSGTIVAQAGNIHLAAADRFVVDFDGDGIISFAVSPKMERAMRGRDAVVKNTGTLRAESGLIAMTASTADSVINGVINTSGIVQASEASVRNGKIILSGDEAKLSGTMSAKTLDLDVLVTSNHANGSGEVADRVNVLSDRVARISDAIDLVTTRGTVNLAAGRYDGGFIIDRSMTLAGAGAGNTVIHGNIITRYLSQTFIGRLLGIGSGIIEVSAAPDSNVNLQGFTVQGAIGLYSPMGIHLASGNLLLNNMVLDGQGKGIGIYQEPYNSFLTTFNTAINNYRTGLSVFSPYSGSSENEKAEGPVDRISALLSLGTSFTGNDLDIKMDADGFITDARLAKFNDASSIPAIRDERVKEPAGIVLLPGVGGPDDDIITRTQRINRFIDALKSGSSLGGDINLDALITPAAGAGDLTEEQIRGELNRRLAIILQNYLDSGKVEDADDAIRSLLLRSI